MDEEARRAAGDDAGARREQLAREICTLGAHLDAATYRFLELLAEFDRCDGWREDGVLSCAHWLSWRCGVGLSAAYEKVRVAHALPGLPRIADALRRGAVSYSKVRAVTRVATPANEARLLEIARHGTASHVERIVRGYRRCAAGGRAIGAREEAGETRARHRARSVVYRAEALDAGFVVVEARLPVEEGTRVVAAIEAAVEMLEAEAAASRAHDDLPRAPDDPGAAMAADLLACTHASPAREPVDNSSAEESAGRARRPRRGAPTRWR